MWLNWWRNQFKHMDKPKTGFWRGFTWKRFARFAIIIFIFNFTFWTIWDYFDPEAIVKDNFTFKSFAVKAVKSILLGFICAVWFEPGIDKDKENPPLIP